MGQLMIYREKKLEKEIPPCLSLFPIWINKKLWSCKYFCLVSSYFLSPLSKPLHCFSSCRPVGDTDLRQWPSFPATLIHNKVHLIYHIIWVFFFLFVCLQNNTQTCVCVYIYLLVWQKHMRNKEDKFCRRSEYLWIFSCIFPLLRISNFNTKSKFMEFLNRIFNACYPLSTTPSQYPPWERNWVCGCLRDLLVWSDFSGLNFWSLKRIGSTFTDFMIWFSVSYSAPLLSNFILVYIIPGK